MGVYSEYLDRPLSFPQLLDERKIQLKRISEFRGRDILVYASDLTNSKASISIDYSDLLPIKDQLANLQGKSLDLILETPGGSGEVAEDIVKLLRHKYDEIAVIIPGWCKSAGTLISMAADEILMDHSSSVGPIDAQLFWQGKIFSADALIEGMKKIKEEVEGTGRLNKAYVPILQGISPGELQSAQNALNFAKELVTQWLAKFKFRNWNTHRSTGKPVTEEERTKRAKEIADELCKHGHWLTHGRSIKMEDLEAMRLQITDYSENEKLADAIQRYHTLLQMTFSTGIYKVFETPTSQIYRALQQIQQGPLPLKNNDVAMVEITCKKCGKKTRVQANLEKAFPLQEGCVAFPADNKLYCQQCHEAIDLNEIRRQIEQQTKKKVIA